MIISHPLLRHVKQWFGPFRGTDSLVPEGVTISTGMRRRKAYYAVITILCTERNKTINVPFLTVMFSMFQRKWGDHLEPRSCSDYDSLCSRPECRSFDSLTAQKTNASFCCLRPAMISHNDGFESTGGAVCDIWAHWLTVSILLFLVISPVPLTHTCKHTHTLATCQGSINALPILLFCSFFLWPSLMVCHLISLHHLVGPRIPIVPFCGAGR